ncbi:MAG: sarcosine oxidase [Gammaproteobacteria bacterium]
MAAHVVRPTDFLIRSFHYRALINEGARFHTLTDAAVAFDYGLEPDEEAVRARDLGLADLSPLPRTGFKGREAIQWLKAQGLTIGDENNRAWRQERPDGAVVARLADTEALILGDLAAIGGLCARLKHAHDHQKPPRCYHVPRGDSSAWFLVTGEHAGAMFAKLCAVDMRHHKFPSGAVAQTSLARMNVIVIRNDLGETPGFHLVFDSASAHYLWRVLKDAMEEFEGRPVGHAALLEL